MQTSAKGKFDELKVRLLLDRLPRVVEFPDSVYSLPFSTTPSGTPSVSRVPSAESTDEEAGSDTLSRTSSIVLSRYGSGETKNMEESALMFEIQTDLAEYLRKNDDLVQKIIMEKDYVMPGFEDHMNLVRDIAIQINISANISKDADLENVADNKWDDSFLELNESVEKNTIPTYNDGKLSLLCNYIVCMVPE